MKRVLPLLLLAFSIAGAAIACDRVGPPSPEEMVAQADLIVRASAYRYGVSPDGDKRVNAAPQSTVRFQVESIVKGRRAPEEIELPGYLGGTDDFNDGAVPYKWVRPGGRGGSCFASTYKSGADYLLVLKLQHGGYTVNWYALGPTNEQLHGPDDPWLVWVRDHAATP